MYDKHTNTKTEFQAVIDNKICIGFNTDMKRKNFIKKLNGSRKVTSVANVSYTWTLEDGIHNVIILI